MIAAGAIVPEGQIVPANKLFAGNPAKFLRDLDAAERENLREVHLESFKLSAIHSERKCEHNP